MLIKKEENSIRIINEKAVILYFRGKNIYRFTRSRVTSVTNQHIIYNTIQYQQNHYNN